ncbi:MAG: hypothetical protein ACOYL1_04685 [Chlamydiia bacterium]|jgi:hypothetical protein
MRFNLFIKKEITHICPVFFFFLIFFTLINWIETLLFEKVGMEGFKFVQVALAAALIAKIVLILDHIPFIDRYKNYPLALPIAWKTFLYWIILFLVRLMIRFAPIFWDNSHHFEADFTQFFTSMEWNIFLSVQVYYLMLLFIYVSFRELVSKIGKKKILELFFG